MARRSSPHDVIEVGGAAPRSAAGPRRAQARFGYIDDPEELEETARMYAERSGESLDDLLREEGAARKGQSVDQYLADRNTPAKGSEPAAAKPEPMKPTRKKAAKKASALPTPTLSPSGSGDFGGLLLGVVGFSLVMAYIEHGWDGPKSWFTAKFFNRPTVGPNAGASATQTEVSA